MRRSRYARIRLIADAQLALGQSHAGAFPAGEDGERDVGHAVVAVYQ
jgi:hypothetical protein